MSHKVGVLGMLVFIIGQMYIQIGLMDLWSWWLVGADIYNPWGLLFTMPLITTGITIMALGAFIISLFFLGFHQRHGSRLALTTFIVTILLAWVDLFPELLLINENISAAGPLFPFYVSLLQGAATLFGTMIILWGITIIALTRHPAWAARPPIAAQETTFTGALFITLGAILILFALTFFPLLLTWSAHYYWAVRSIYHYPLIFTTILWIISLLHHPPPT